MTNEEINKRITEAREPKPDKDFVARICINGYWRSPKEEWVLDDHTQWVPLHDWCGSEDASAVLLEEMKATVEMFTWRMADVEPWQWEFHVGGKDGKLVAHDPDRRVAIAMAYLAWKEHPQ